MYFYSNANSGRARGGEVLREIENVAKDVAGKLKDYFENVDAPSAINHLQKQFRPLIDISQDDNNLYIRAEIPGVAKEDISLTMKGNGKIEIAGVKTHVLPDSEIPIGRSERRYGKFSREIDLPENFEVDSENISAKYNNGVLIITLPKTAKGNGVTINIS